MPDKETSAQVSELASKYIDFTTEDLMTDFGNACSTGFFHKPFEYLEKLTSDIRTLAASCLSQDETPKEET